MPDQPSYRQLPQELPPKARPLHLVLELLGVLILVVLINWAAGVYLAHFSTNQGYWTIHQKWFLLGRLDEPVDWLVLGDSSCNQGVIPSVLEEELGGRALNLCMVGNITVLGDLWLLEEYLARFDPPQAIILVHVYDVWPRDLNPVLLGQIPRPWGFWSDHALGEDLLEDPDVRSQLFLERYVPLLSQPVTLTKLMRSTFFLQHNPLSPPWRMDADGFVIASEPYPDIVRRDAQDHLDELSDNPFSISPINRQSYGEITDLAERYKIPVYVFNSPMYEGLYTAPAFRAYFDDAQAQVLRLAEEAYFARIVREVMTFPAEQMQTVDHVTLPAAEAFTRWLAEQIRR
ncbi:MAG TPA: hypothetical protein PKM21_00965 [Anaerolineales bacterium]|nr:hypothetical protein [Anaerolineales bacterium]